MGSCDSFFEHFSGSSKRSVIGSSQDSLLAIIALLFQCAALGVHSKVHTLFMLCDTTTKFLNLLYPKSGS